MNTQDETEDLYAPMSDDQIDDLFGAGTAAKVREATGAQTDQQRSTKLIASCTRPLKACAAMIDAGLIDASEVGGVSHELKCLHLGESYPIYDYGFVLRTKTGWELRRYVLPRSYVNCLAHWTRSSKPTSRTRHHTRMHGRSSPNVRKHHHETRRSRPKVQPPT